MALNFRYYEKKRGHRRTGSRAIGSAGEAVFFAVLFVLGAVGVAAGILFLVVPQWRVNHGFVAHTCKVTDKRVVEVPGDDGATLYRPEIGVRYELNGEIYRVWAYDIHSTCFSNRDRCQAIVDNFAKNESQLCWYDPTNPRVVVLVRGYQWWIWLVFMVPASCVIIGVGGMVYALVHRGRSAEHRASVSQRAKRHELLELGTVESPFPFVPDCGEVTSSPGTRLAFRLPLTRSPGWLLFGLLLVTVVWNGIVTFFVVMAGRGIVEGRPDWLLIFFTFPFFVAGVGLIVLFVRQLLETIVIGPTLAEISAHPLRPGGHYELFVSQSGRLKMKSFEVALVCDEEATFRQGTNARTETREVHCQSLLVRDAVEITPTAAFDVQCSLEVPAGAMHSFRAAHNAVVWKIRVKGHVVKGPSFERCFPIIVYPSSVDAHPSPVNRNPP